MTETTSETKEIVRKKSLYDYQSEAIEQIFGKLDQFPEKYNWNFIVNQYCKLFEKK